jgi:phosphate transport system substrate-binding protein
VKHFGTKHLKTIAVVGFLTTTLFPAAALDISGAGATFPFPIYAKWADTYKKETGVGLNYQSIGSGGGIKQIEARTVAFGATDAPLKGPELEKEWPRPIFDGDGRHIADRALERVHHAWGDSKL